MNKEYNCISHFGILGMKWGVRRYQNPDGSLTELGKKRDAKDADKKIDRYKTGIYVRANNYASDRINGQWLENFNKKWERAFEGYKDWTDSPKYSKYEKEYFKNLNSFMNESLSKDPKSAIRTKFGTTYTARILDEQGGLTWGTTKEWKDFNKKQSKKK